MSSELVKSTNSLPFLKDSEKDYWNKLLDSNIRAGTMACMWCMKAQLVKKTSLAFHRWKFVIARESWYGHSSPSKNQNLNASRPTSTSHPHSVEKTLNHAGARPVSAVLANAITLMNQLKETDAERDVNTRLFASPSASVKAANAAATSVLEFDSKSHGDLPKTSSGAGSITSVSVSGPAGASGFPWERRRRAGSHGSIDTESGLFDGSGSNGGSGGVGEFKDGDGQSAETLAAYNRQRLAYVLRSILPESAGGGGNGADPQQAYAMNLDGSRRTGNTGSELSPGYHGEEELTAYLRNALLSQNHDAATRGQILMALSQNMVNKPPSINTQRNLHNNTNYDYSGNSGTGTGSGGHHQGEHGDHNTTDLEVSSRSSLSLLKISGSNPSQINTSSSFPRARANSRTNSPNARLSRKSMDNSIGGSGGSVRGNVQGSVYNDYSYDSSRPYYADNHTASTTNNSNNKTFPETPDPYNNNNNNNGVHGRTYPSSASSLRNGGGSVSGHSLHSDYSYNSHYTNNTNHTNTNNVNYNHYSSNTSINTMHTNTKKPRAVPGYLMPTNSFRKKQSSAGSVNSGGKSGGIGSGRARSPGMITSSTSKHVAVLGNGGSSPTAYTVKGSSGSSIGGLGGSGGRSGSSGRGGDRGSGGDNGSNVFYAGAGAHNTTANTNTNSRTTTPNRTHLNNTTNNTNNTNTTNTSYANMSFLDYQARKANLHTNSGHRSPVRRNSANIDTSRVNGGSVGGSIGGSVYGDEDETDSSLAAPSSHLPVRTQPQTQIQVPPLALPLPPLSTPLPLPLSSQSEVPEVPQTVHTVQGTTNQPSLPLALSEPVLPPSLRSQTHTPRQDSNALTNHNTDPINTNTNSNNTNPDLVYEVYDSYHNSTLHSNSNDLYEHSLVHKNTTNANNNTSNASATANNTITNTNSSSGEYAYEPHSPTEHILYHDSHPTNPSTDNAYYNHTTHSHNTHNTHNTHSTTQPFVANATNTLRPASTTTNNTTTTTSSGKRSNPNSGGKSKPKGMDKAQLELIMYGDVHGRTPNWHKTLRN